MKLYFKIWIFNGTVNAVKSLEDAKKRFLGKSFSAKGFNIEDFYIDGGKDPGFSIGKITDCLDFWIDGSKRRVWLTLEIEFVNSDCLWKEKPF